MKPILQCHRDLHAADDLIDLRPNSSFMKQLSCNVLTPYLKELDRRVESLIPSDVHDFLTNFFKDELTGSAWQTKVDELCCPNRNDWLMVSTVRILRRTLPVLCVRPLFLNNCF